MRNKNKKVRRTVVFVIDALRPDLISMENTPTLFHLMQNGIRFANSRALFPTLTRVSTAALGTGAHPCKNGILGNNIYVPAIDKFQAVSTGTLETMQKLSALNNGCAVQAKTLAQRLAQKNLLYAAVSSGTPGSAFLLNPAALNNCGAVVNGYIQRNEVAAFPENINSEILLRFPNTPDETKADETFGQRVSWTEDVLCDYVIEKLDADVIVNWIAEPDHSQHFYDVGSPKAMEMVCLTDSKIKDVVSRIADRGEFEETNFFFLSDHGCTKCREAIDLEHKLLSEGLKAGKRSNDVIVVDNDELAFLHVKDRNPERIQEIVEYLQKQDFTDVIFTAPKDGGEQGLISGTFSMDLIHLWNEKIGPDIVVTFPWSSDKNAYGYPGLDFQMRDFTGRIKGPQSSHGSMNPFSIRNVAFALGPDFKKDVTSYVPVNLLDIAATVLHIYGIEKDDDIDGRVIEEMFVGGADCEKIPVSTMPYYAINSDANYKAVLMLSYAEGKSYLDKGWRVY